MKHAITNATNGGDCAVVCADAPCYPLAPACGKRTGYAQGSVTGKMA